MAIMAFPSPSTKGTKHSVVIHGSGPAIHVKTKSTAKILVVSKHSVSEIPVSGNTDVNFAA